MMRLGHHAVASPIAIGSAWGMVTIHVNTLIALGCAGLIVYTSTWNDLDHPRFKGKYHPGAALVRTSGYLGYMLRTDNDKERNDVHRGPSHCIEWCLLAGLTTWGILALMPLTRGIAMWVGAAIFIGTASHILADWPTPSGVPLSAIYNYVRYREVWRRHTLNLFSTDSAGERFLAIPAMFLVSCLMLLGMLGWLVPITSWLLGGLL